MTEQNRSHAVMAQRWQAKARPGESNEAALHRELDFYPTPLWAARAGCEIIRMIDPDSKIAWEPACGQGHMARAMSEFFPMVCATDIYPYGFGGEFDFLGNDPAPMDVQPDWIVTNPPFAQGFDFAERALAAARCGVAFLCRLAFIESTQRFPLFERENALTLLAPFSERVTMTLGRIDPDVSTATAYAWFIWSKLPRGHHRVMLIPPGTKTRLTRPGDNIVQLPLLDYDRQRNAQGNDPS